MDLPVSSSHMATSEEGDHRERTTQFDPTWDGNQSVAETVAEAVAEVAGANPESLPPMERSINPEALDSLFETAGEEAPLGGCVTFSYYGYTVVVRSTGQVLLRE